MTGRAVEGAGAAAAPSTSLLKAPRTGFEPVTNRLTVDRSTAELPRNTGKSLACPLSFQQPFLAGIRLESTNGHGGPDGALAHGERPIAAVQFLQPVGDPECSQALRTEMTHQHQHLLLAPGIQQSRGLIQKQ